MRYGCRDSKHDLFGGDAVHSVALTIRYRSVHDSHINLLGRRPNDMAAPALPTIRQWGHVVSSISPRELVSEFGRLAESAIASFDALPDGPEPCNDKAGYHRVCVTIPLPRLFFDQLMNGHTGYRAHYAADIGGGERFNHQLVAGIVSTFIESQQLHEIDFLARSALTLSSVHLPRFGTQSSSPIRAANDYLSTLPEAIQLPRWKQYWHFKDGPHKGLLAPILEGTSVLLNGSFVNQAGEAYEQKPGRSQQLFDSGWT